MWNLLSDHLQWKEQIKTFIFTGRSCPGGEIPCSGNGQCDPTTGFCNCQEGHQGSDCSGNKNVTIH